MRHPVSLQRLVSLLAPKSPIPKVVEKATPSTSQTLQKPPAPPPQGPTWYKHATLNQGKARKFRQARSQLRNRKIEERSKTSTVLGSPAEGQESSSRRVVLTNEETASKKAMDLWTKRRLPKVVLLSHDHALKRDVAIAIGKTHNVVMFSTIHWHMLYDCDIVLLDSKLEEYTVEAYLTRKLRQGDLYKNLLQLEHLIHDRPELSGWSMPTEDMYPPTTYSFPDFYETYYGLEFPHYATKIERLLRDANTQLRRLRQALQDESGFSPVRITDPRFPNVIAKPFILIPPLESRYRQPMAFAEFLEQWLAYCKSRLSDEVMERYQQPQEMIKLPYLSGFDHPHGREKFLNLTTWKMEIMLAKWRTDKILAKWSEDYRKSVLHESDHLKE